MNGDRDRRGQSTAQKPERIRFAAEPYERRKSEHGTQRDERLGAQ